jgi:glutaredoxin
MISIFTKPDCAYSAMIVHLLNELGIAYKERNIVTDFEAAVELIEHGGQPQVPYMIDDATGTDLYESEQIAEYLQTMYGGGAKPQE